MKQGTVLAIVLCVLLLASCSFDYGQDVELSELAKTTPDLSLVNAKHSVIRNSKVTLTMSAAQIEVYTLDNRRNLTALSFVQYDNDGKVTAEGTAGAAEQKIDSENIVFSQGIEIRMTEGDTLVRAEGLSWDATTKTFSSNSDEEILLRRGTATEIRGTGLRIDTVNRFMEFSGAVNGTLSE